MDIHRHLAVNEFNFCCFQRSSFAYHTGIKFFVFSLAADIMASTMMAPGSFAPEDAGTTSASRLLSATQSLDKLPVTKVPFLDTIDHYVLNATESHRIASLVLRCSSEVDTHSFVEHITRAYAHFVASFTGQNDISFVRLNSFGSSSLDEKAKAVCVSARGLLRNESPKSLEIDYYTVESDVKVETQFGLQFSGHLTEENVEKIVGSEVSFKSRLFLRLLTWTRASYFEFTVLRLLGRYLFRLNARRN